MPTMNWKPRHDARSKDHGVATLLPHAELPESGPWSVAPLVQPSDGPCVGYAIATAICASPEDADRIYAIAKTLDTMPGQSYTGTSVLAGAKAAKALDLIESYRWCFGVDDVLGTLDRLGPVVLGLQWTTGMKSPHEGLMTATGAPIGGHAVVAVDYDDDLKGLYPGGPHIRIQNSWGSRWGIHGTAWLSVADLTRQLAKSGEACLVVPA